MRRRLAVLAVVALALPAASTRATTPAFGWLAANGVPVYCGSGGGPFVALTWDDGPSRYTASVLDEIRLAHARATFFVVGSRVGERPDLVREEARIGELGNHTWDHIRLTNPDKRLVAREVRWTQAEIYRTVGWRPLMFRPPYGVIGPAALELTRALGLLDVRWTVDSGDSLPWASLGESVRTAVAGLRPGSIVLMHDAHPWSALEARAVLRATRRRGLVPVTVSELLALDPPGWRQLTISADGRRGC